MKHRSLMSLALAASVAVGCGGTPARVQAPYQLESGEKLKLEIVRQDQVPDDAISSFRARLDAQLQESGLLAPPKDLWANTLEVVIVELAMREGDVPESVRSKVLIKDARTQVTAFELGVESKSLRGGTLHALLEQHADEIVQTLRAGKS